MLKSAFSGQGERKMCVSEGDAVMHRGTAIHVVSAWDLSPWTYSTSPNSQASPNTQKCELNRQGGETRVG